MAICIPKILFTMIIFNPILPSREGGGTTSSKNVQGCSCQTVEDD